MMLLPSISRRSRATRTFASYRVARCTNFAAARACMPSWLTTITISADGSDEHDAVNALVALVQSGFGEDACSA